MTQRKDGIYQEQVTVVVNGVKKQKYFYGKTPGAVKAKIAAYTGEIERGPLFDEVADAWYKEAAPSLKQGTTKTYDPCVERAKAWFAERPIKNIMPSEIDDFLEDFAAKKQAKQKTVKNQKTVLNAIFRRATKRPWNLQYNPMDSVRIPSGLKSNGRAIASDDDIDRIIKSVKEPFGLCAFLALYTGLRRGEILAIRGQDIDVKNKLLHVRGQITHEGNVPTYSDTKTSAGERDVILIDKVIAHLPKLKPDQYLFSEPDGGPLRQHMFNRLWQAYQEASGVTCTLHQLRHAYATMLFELEIDEKDAQALLGHKDITTTKNIYTHIRKSHQDTLREKLNNM